MRFDFNVYKFDYNKRKTILHKESVGQVKSIKDFPIFIKDDEEYIFKPLSKTKPFCTPLFSYSEVFWSTIIKNFFDETSPIYKLAVVYDYEINYPKYYSKGVICKNVTKDSEYLVNLLEYYNSNNDSKVNISNYINYCGQFYNYTDILRDIYKRKDLSEKLCKQILISILKQDVNFHYENVSFIYKDNQLLSLAPPMDHEFSIPFMFYDDTLNYLYYYGILRNVYTLNKATTKNSVHEENIINNIDYICSNYPQVVEEFISQLQNFIKKFKSSNFYMSNDFGYIDKISSNLYKYYEILLKNGDLQLAEKIKSNINLVQVDLDKFSDNVKKDILSISISYYNYLCNKLNVKKYVIN